MEKDLFCVKVIVVYCLQLCALQGDVRMTVSG